MVEVRCQTKNPKNPLTDHGTFTLKNSQTRRTSLFWFLTVELDFFVAVTLLSHVRLFENLWTTARLASVSFTFSWNLLKLMSIELGMLSSLSSSAALFSFCFQSFPASGSLPVSRLFVSDSQSIGASASASVFPMNIQSWFPLVLTGLISLQSKLWYALVFPNILYLLPALIPPSLWSSVLVLIPILQVSRLWFRGVKELHLLCCLW